MTLLADYKLLSQAQLQTLLGDNYPSATQKTMRLLFDHGRVHPIYQPLTHQGAATAFYILTQKGRAELKQEIETITDDNLQGIPKANLSALFITHTKCTNDVRITITQATTSAGYEITQWIGEAELKAQHNIKPTRIKIPNHRQPIPLVPDSYFAIKRPNGGTAHFFLELDRGTMQIARFTRKVAAYTQFYKGGDFANQYNGKAFRVLTVVDTQTNQRVKNLLEASQKIQGAGRRFWFTHLPEITPETALSAPIWQVTNDRGEHPLYK